MAKVGSKLQVTIPKRIAERYGIQPGHEIEFLPAADSLRVVPARAAVGHATSVAERLHWFDAATARQRKRQRQAPGRPRRAPSERGWIREDLYDRPRPR